MSDKLTKIAQNGTLMIVKTQISKEDALRVVLRMFRYHADLLGETEARELMIEEGFGDSSDAENSDHHKNVLPQRTKHRGGQMTAPDDELGEALARYIDPSHSEFDLEFTTEAMKIRPDWFSDNERTRVSEWVKQRSNN